MHVHEDRSTSADATRLFLPALATLLGCILVGACGADEAAGSIEQRLRACNLITAGELQMPRDDPGQQCANQCVFDASCAEISDFLCFSSGPLLPCIEGCTGRPPFTCASGEQISGSAACDVFPDCTDGSDEMGCTYFECDDGTRLGMSDRCDLEEDCVDGSDEVGCAALICD